MSLNDQCALFQVIIPKALWHFYGVFGLFSVELDSHDLRLSCEDSSDLIFVSCFLLCPGINCMFWLRFDSSPCASSLRSVPCGGSVPSLPRLLWGREAWRPRRKLLSAVLPARRHSFPADQWTQRRLALRPEPADGTVSDHQPFSQGQLNTSCASELNNHVSTMRSLFWEQGLYGCFTTAWNTARFSFCWKQV